MERINQILVRNWEQKLLHAQENLRYSQANLRDAEQNLVEAKDRLDANKIEVGQMEKILDGLKGPNGKVTNNS